MLVRLWLLALMVASAVWLGAAGSARAGEAWQVAALSAPPAPSAGSTLLRPAMGMLPQGTPLLVTGTVFRDCSDCPEMVVMPVGEVVIGVTAGEEELEQVPLRFRGRAEPAHKVGIAYPFAVSRYEVTVGEFARFAAATGRRMDGCWISANKEWKLMEERSWRMPGYGQTERDPVVCVSWEDARAYTDWLSGVLKQKYRLLSEAEWEYVARVGSSTQRPWGQAIGKNFTNCIGCGSRWDGQRPAPAGSFSVNRFGLYDMLGNVAEWVDDCWHDNYNGAPIDGSSWQSGGNCQFRVIRGGSWVDPPRNIRSAQRDRDTPQMRSIFLGFRIARVITP